MNIDTKFLKFALRETMPILLFTAGTALVFILPKPYSVWLGSLMLSVIAVGFLMYYVDMLRFRFECRQREQQRSWEILKDK